MPRGMDERFEDPSDEAADEDAAIETEPTETAAAVESNGRDTDAATGDESDEETVASTSATTESATGSEGEADDEPLNIRKDWDSATIYVEPEQSEDIEISFTRLKKQLKREDITLEKNKHFYRGVFEVAFGEHREETKAKIRDLAKQDSD